MTASARLVLDALTPVAAYAALRRAAPEGASFLFESVVGGERWGRKTLLGYRPRRDATLTAEGWTVREADGAGRVFPGDAWAGAASIFGAESRPGEGREEALARSHFGFFAYDLVAATHRVPSLGPGDGPLARFVGGCTLVVFDNLEQTVTVVGPTEADVARALGDLSAPAPALAGFPVPDRARLPDDVALGVTDAEYAARVVRAKEYIAAGDAFQIVLARTFSLPRGGRDPLDAYRALRVMNPSPYMYFLDLPAPPGGPGAGRTQILGASPETLVRVEGGRMTVRPIAGTRPRGRTAAEDARLAAELSADPKELAEHVMLVDLGRNDVGRVAEIGTVEVVRRMEIERYSHVMHLVSEVEGRLPPGLSALEALRAAFPAGTLSGAPKLRAMQIIAELEGRPRGLYGGAVGYVTPGGDLDFAIAIRTAVCEGGRVVVTAGAGIVEASVPEAEAAETWSKAKGVLSAVAAAPGALRAAVSPQRG